MIASFRKKFNQQFNQLRYQKYIEALNDVYKKPIEFRLAETPIFVDRDFQQKMIETCETIIDTITSDHFKELSANAIPQEDYIPGVEKNCQMMAFDFGICETDDQKIVPMLIEMQGFPSLYGFQVLMANKMQECFEIPDNVSPFLNNQSEEVYLKTLKQTIVGPYNPEEVVLLEIKPDDQKTWIDFYATKSYTGIHICCITALISEEDRLYYQHPISGERIQIKRIYNRVIFDELHTRKEELGEIINLKHPWNVEWMPHPNWFYRISKYTLPLLQHPFIPTTRFLNSCNPLPNDLENYVLKPLFSFAGKGVVIHVTKEIVDAIKDPQNWILQQKVQYKEIIETPSSPAKAEIRIMYLWNEHWDRPRPVINLARLSKGEMIGVNFNKDKDWVGGSICYFEK